MGQFMSLMSFFWGGSKIERRVLMVGLDNAGKTTLLYKLKLGEVVHAVPTIGFNVDTVTYKNVNLTVWDVGGQEILRNLWKHYASNASALIYVVDSSESEERMYEAKLELQAMLDQYELQGVPVLVFCNKQDMPNALKSSEIAEKLDMKSLNRRQWHVQACIAKLGDGLYEGLDWLARELNRR